MGIIRTMCVERDSADSDVNSEGRRCEHDKAQSSIGPSGQRKRGQDVHYDLERPASTAMLCGDDEGGARGHFRDPLHELGSRRIGQNGFQVLQTRGDPQYAFVPADSNDEFEIALMPSFPWPVTEEGTKSPELAFCVGSESGGDSCKSVASVPPLEGHPAIHESAVLGAPPGMFQAGIVKKMHEVISEVPVRKCGIRRLQGDRSL